MVKYMKFVSLLSKPDALKLKSVPVKKPVVKYKSQKNKKQDNFLGN